MSKAGGTLAGSSNFWIRRPGLVPLLDTTTGIIDYAADIQVNGGAFCQFMVVRGGSSVPVGVSLHELPRTIGVPFRVVISIDLDSGAVTATQDGNPIATSAATLASCFAL